MISALMMLALGLANFGYYAVKVVADIRARRWGWAAYGALLGSIGSITFAMMINIMLSFLKSSPG